MFHLQKIRLEIHEGIKIKEKKKRSWEQICKKSTGFLFPFFLSFICDLYLISMHHCITLNAISHTHTHTVSRNAERHNLYYMHSTYSRSLSLPPLHIKHHPLSHTSHVTPLIMGVVSLRLSLALSPTASHQTAPSPTHLSRHPSHNGRGFIKTLARSLSHRFTSNSTLSHTPLTSPLS